MDSIIMAFDTETTGLIPSKHCLIQIAGVFFVNGEREQNFNFEMAPHPKAEIDKSALAENQRKLNEIKELPDQKIVFEKFLKMVLKLKGHPNNRITLLGFNNSRFDNIFLEKWFAVNSTISPYSIFRPESLDVMVLATQYLLNRRQYMPNFKLATVATELGIQFNVINLHTAIDDTELTLKIYDAICSGQDSDRFTEFAHYEVYTDSGGYTQTLTDKKYPKNYRNFRKFISKFGDNRTRVKNMRL